MSDTNIWAELEAAGVDIGPVEKTEHYDNGPVYLIRGTDGTRISFGPEYSGGELQGWTYCSYDEEDGVIANDGGPTLAGIIPALVEWQNVFGKGSWTNPEDSDGPHAEWCEHYEEEASDDE